MKRGLNLLKNTQEEVSDSFLTNEEDIPWLEGRPDKIINLDSNEEMKGNSIFYKILCQEEITMLILKAVNGSL